MSRKMSNASGIVNERVEIHEALDTLLARARANLLAQRAG